MEHPTYPNALDAIRAAGCKPSPVGLPGITSRTSPGWDMDAMMTTMRQQRPAMAYLVPDFHNPTGRVMS
ncbi:PLP-dependent aminotransferase family protein, partial [Paraburkholderia sp. SIMBA_030]